ncbi:MAG TPA: hypothetical protein VFI84_01100, partial [Candidatus Saccharimonadales bacterium]|nr:hypothetical protein [Candidatus Saccharimonadales bacterium]
KKQAPIDPTADWVAYTGTAFSLKYPKTWVMAAHPELCADNILLLGPNKDSVGHCGSEGFGEVAFTFSSSHGCFPLDDTYTDKTNLAVTISGMSGTKETGTAKATNSEGSGLQPAGTKVVQYCFNSTNKHYVATYNQQPAYPDVLSDFELIVTKTLKFQ